MAFPNFSMQDDGVNNANNNDLLLQQNGIPYDRKLLAVDFLVIARHFAA
jgi:hypothetical protein